MPAAARTSSRRSRPCACRQFDAELSVRVLNDAFASARIDDIDLGSPCNSLAFPDRIIGRVVRSLSPLCDLLSIAITVLIVRDATRSRQELVAQPVPQLFIQDDL